MVSDSASCRRWRTVHLDFQSLAILLFNYWVVNAVAWHCLYITVGTACEHCLRKHHAARKDVLNAASQIPPPLPPFVFLMCKQAPYFRSPGSFSSKSAVFSLVLSIVSLDDSCYMMHKSHLLCTVLQFGITSSLVHLWTDCLDLRK